MRALANTEASANAAALKKMRNALEAQMTELHNIQAEVHHYREQLQLTQRDEAADISL
jgi:DNA-binding transcriptional regulator YiaG